MILGILFMYASNFHRMIPSVLTAKAAGHRRPYSLSPVAEPIEGRILLSFLLPFGAKVNQVHAGGVVDVVSVSGPGQVHTTKMAHGLVEIRLSGTTQDSTVNVSSLRAKAARNSPLQIGKIVVQSGRLGSFQGLTTSDLVGQMSAIIGPVNSLQFDSLGPAAQIDIAGNLAQLTVNRTLELGPMGHINVTGDLTGSLSVVNNLMLDGGEINIGRDLSATVTVGGGLAIEDGGHLSVARNLGGSSTNVSTSSTSTAVSSTISSTATLTSGLTSGTATGGAGGTGSAAGSAASSTGSSGVSTAVTLSGASPSSSNGASSAASGNGGITVVGNLSLDSNGMLQVGGNLGTLTIGGSVEASAGGEIQIARNLTSLAIGGNLQTSAGGEINVAGNLGTLSVTGSVQGKGKDDILVGDNLSQLTVLGGGNGVPGLLSVDIVASTSILGLDIRNGVANSQIQAAYLINGGTPGTGSNSWNIGPNVMSLVTSSGADSRVAVLDSIIQAGSEIENMTIGGDVVSDQATNSSGTPTRIIAGETLNNVFAANGVIDNFQITGNLINSILAASVEPNPLTGYYDEPAGAIEVGFVAAAAPATTSNTTGEPSVPSQSVDIGVGTNASPVSNVGLIVSKSNGMSANPTQYAQLQGSPLFVSTAPPFATPQDPEMEAVLPGGAINPSFAPKFQLVPPAAAAGSQLPLPSKSMVLGSVITTTPHVSGTDYAGIFASNTNGVLVGAFPTSAPVSPAAAD